MHFYSLEKLLNLHDGYRKVFKIDEHHLLLMQIDGELFLIESECPHRGHPLSESDIHGNQLRCPRHGYQFSLPGGELSLATEETCRGLRPYDLIYQDRDVGVWL